MESLVGEDTRAPLDWSSESSSCGWRSMMPRVSVCIPVCNGERFLGEAIRSVLSQTFDDLELIVCDNASTDGSLRVARSFDDRRIAVYTSSTRLEMAENWNRCLQLARGDYVCIFHADDLMYPENLMAKVNFLDTHSDVGMVHSSVHIVDESGAIVSTGWQNQPEGTCIETGLKAVARMIYLNPVCASSVIMRRSVVQRVGGFDQRFRFAPDWDLWLRIAFETPIGYIREPLVGYRVHSGQGTVQFTESGESLSEEERVIAAFLSRVGNQDRLLRVARKGQALRALRLCLSRARKGNLRRACEVIGYAVRMYPQVVIDPEGLTVLLRIPLSFLRSFGERRLVS